MNWTLAKRVSSYLPRCIYVFCLPLLLVQVENNTKNAVLNGTLTSSIKYEPQKFYVSIWWQ